MLLSIGDCEFSPFLLLFFSYVFCILSMTFRCGSIFSERAAEEYVKCAVYFLFVSPSRLYFENYQEKKHFHSFSLRPDFVLLCFAHSVLYIHMHICTSYMYIIYTSEHLRHVQRFCDMKILDYNATNSLVCMSIELQFCSFLLIAFFFRVFLLCYVLFFQV